MRRLAILVVAVTLLGGGLWLRATPVTVATTTSTTTIAPTTTTTLAGPPDTCSATGATAPSFGCVSWHPQDVWSGSVASVYTASFTFDRAQPTALAYAGWLRTSTTDLALYPGYEGPGPSSLARGPEMVPPTGYPRLLATFNSGFYEKDAVGGFYTNHTLYFPMVKGLATVVRYADGTVDIVAWSGGPRPSANVLMARQNLSLLVDGSAATTVTATNSLWGVTLHGAAAVWRTGLGVDANGDLIYVAAPNVTAQGLAAVMVHLRVVRAMELDINPEWPIFVTYGGPGAQSPSLDVANPNQIAHRFLYPSTKDFFAVFATSSPGEAQPW